MNEWLVEFVFFSVTLSSSSVERSTKRSLLTTPMYSTAGKLQQHETTCTERAYNRLKNNLIHYHCARLGETDCFFNHSSQCFNELISCHIFMLSYRFRWEIHVEYSRNKDRLDAVWMKYFQLLDLLVWITAFIHSFGFDCIYNLLTCVPEKKFVVGSTFGYYDANGNNLLERDELIAIEHLDHLDRLSRTCHLADLLTYDDLDHEVNGTISKTEFFIAFS